MMKKLMALLLTAVFMFALAACTDGGSSSAPAGDSSVEGQPDTSSGASSEEVDTVSDALNLLTTVWGSYGDDEKFPAAGGDSSEENMSMDGPGKFGLENTEALDSTLGLPAASVDKIDDAASLMHMMNANTFTCGAFHVKSADDVDALAAELKENIMNRQWVCGFPDKLVIVSVNDYVVSFFGNEDIIDTFLAKLTAAYPSAKTISEDAIA